MSRLRPWHISLLLGALAAGIAVAKYGVSAFPAWVYTYDIARNWQDPSLAPLMVPPADYLQPNFLLAWLVGAAGFLSAQSYFIAHLVVALLAIMLPFWMSAVRESVSGARLMFILLVGGPVVAVLITWANGYDALTVVGITVGALARWPWIAACGWLLAAFNHPAVGPLAFVLWALFVLVAEGLDDSRRREGVIRVLLSGLAVVIAIMANDRLMAAWGGNTSRAQWLELSGSGNLWDMYWPSMPLVLFGALGIGWLIFLHPRVLQFWAYRLLVVEVLVAAVSLPWLVLDATRIVGIVVLGVALAGVKDLCHPARTSARLFPETLDGMWQWWSVAAAITPVPLVFSGQVVYLGWGAFLGLNSALQPPSGYELVR